MNQLLRNTWVEIDLLQFEQNIRALKDFIGPGVKIAPVVKADAYGHGAKVVAAELERMGVEILSCAMLAEAIELRDAGIQSPILVMGYTENRHLGLAVARDVALTIFEYEQAEIISREAEKLNKIARIHIKVDTGFHRLGKTPSDEFANEIVRMSRLPHLALEGIFSHLRLADAPGDQEQFDLFTSFIRVLDQAGIKFKYAHVSDSIAAIKYKEFAMDMIRPGAIIYGYVPKYQIGRIGVKPVMTFKTKVTRVQRIAKGDGVGYDEEYQAGDGASVATLAAGYADGYPRSLSRKAEVLIRGQRAKIIGIICMDQMMVDVSAIDNVKPGDEAILFGPQEGAPSVEELSALAGTNKNSIISAISRRVPRVYMKGGTIVRIVDYLAKS